MTDHGSSFFLITIFGLAVILMVFGMKYFSAGRQARQRLAGEGAYHELAQRAVAAQSAGATSLATVQSDLADVRAKLAAIEQVLRQVE